MKTLETIGFAIIAVGIAAIGYGYGQIEAASKISSA